MLSKKMGVILLLVVMACAFNLHAEETWVITSLNWEPYSSAQMTNEGNSIQKLREILKKEGIRLIVEFYPWKRAQVKAKMKDYVGYFPAWPEEVAYGFVASPPVDWSWVGVLKQVGSDVEFQSIDELFRKYRVGVVTTYIYPKLIEDAMKKYPDHVDGAPNEISLLRKLSKGRNDVAITDPDVMMYLADREGIFNIETVRQIMKKELVIAFRDGEDNRARIILLKRLLKEK